MKKEHEDLARVEWEWPSDQPLTAPENETKDATAPLDDEDIAWLNAPMGPLGTSVQEKAHAYLSRLLVSHAPQCEPLPDLLGLCTQIDNLLTALPKWRDIATAPNDVAVLTYRGAGLMAVAENIADPSKFPKVPAPRFWCCTDGMALLNVTHWMPLPKAPK